MANSGQLMAESGVHEVDRLGNQASSGGLAWLTGPSPSAAELGLPCIRSEPLHLRTVQDERAIDKAAVFDGVNFATMIRFSAVLSGPGFKEALRAVHRDPASVSATERKALDAHMRRCFEQEAGRGQAITSEKASQMLIKGLTELTN